MSITKVQLRADHFKKRLTREERRKLKCTYCKETGHEVDDCFKLQGILDWYKRYKENRQLARANFAENEDDTTSSHGGLEQKETTSDMSKLIQTEIARCFNNYMQQQGNNYPKGDVNMVHEQLSKRTPFEGHYAFKILSSMEKTAWIVDSGASTHICCTPELFYCTYKLSKPTEVHLPDGSSHKVLDARKVRLSKDIVLVDVLYIPGFTHNLLSVAQLIHDLGIKCIFYQNHCVFQKEHSDKLLEVGKLKGNLYIINSTTENYYVNFSNPKRMTMLEWHVFLGHPSLTTMKHMKILDQKQLTDATKAIENYEVCLKAKQARTQFLILNKRTQGLFEIHADIWGSYIEDNICGTRYMLTLVEDHSRMIWIYLLHGKDQISKVLQA